MSIAAAHSQTRPFYRSSYRNAYRRNAVNTGFHGTSYRDNYSSGRIKDSVLLDGACGTGGMLTVAQNRLLELAKKHGKEVAIHLFGQEINPETYDKVRRHFIWQRKTQIFHQNIIDAPETSWYFIFNEKWELFKGKPAEKQGRKARRG